MTRIRNRIAGRDGGFHIHGGYYPGTAGCIEMEDYDKKQEALREFDKMMQDYGEQIDLEVYYPRPF